MEFIKPYELDKDSPIKSNITCPGGRFNIAQSNFVRFSELLQRCSSNKLVLHFRELQASDLSKRIGSGIMFDFDLLQTSDKNEITLKDFTPFLRRIFTIFKSLLKIDDDDIIHMGVITKKSLIYKEEVKQYKNGFHILIPSIKISRQAKKLIYNELLNDNRLQTIFKSTFNNNLRDAFDSGSYSVPTFFMYNCKDNSTEPYELFNIYKITYYDGLQLDILNKEAIIKTYNIISELSLNFDSDLFVKKYYDLQDIYNARIADAEAQSNKFEEEREKAISTFSSYESYVDEYLTYYKKLVLEILDIKRAEDRNMWRDTIFAIANINPSLRAAFKPIAELFSMRSENKWNRQEFEKIWNEAISSTSNNKLTVKSIIYWANIDNKEKYKKLTDKDIINTIELDVYNSDNRILDGTLYQFQFAHYLNHLFKQKFVYDIDNNGKGKWYEFVLDNDSHDVGEIYKWREEIKPDSLIMYLSNKLPQTINKVILKAEDRIRNNPDNEKENEYVAFRTKNLKNSAKDLYKSAFKDGIIKEAEKFFRERGFLKKLDSDQNTMGVGNGVLELSENPKLIKDYHNYPISLYTETNYEPYNKNNPNTIRLLKVLLDLFPEDEMDAFHYIMYYLASCLDGKPKDSIILILTGSGCHSIDTPIMMYDGTIKKVQDVQINDKLMGDDNSPRIVQELFRGRDQMVRIKPIKGDSFIVNINHVLSLKNKKDNNILDIKIKDLLKYDLSYFKNLYLYKLSSYDNDLYGFEIELLGEDDYYGFELDKNHRYVTGDYYVHHNSNGKSFFAELVKSIMGKYGAKMAMSFLTESRGKSAGADEQLMFLKNARLAYYSETDKNEVLNTAKLKEITSQETLSGRGIFEKQTNFRPTCSHMVTTNYQFSIKTTDHGIWRRIVTYSFKMKFDDNPDPNNKYEKKNDPTIAKEFSFNPELKKSFLSILVEYYKDLYINHNGMLKNIMKPTIDKETAEYRNQEDIINRFIDEYCIYSPNSTICLSELIDKYEMWYENNISKNHVPEKVEISNQLINSKIVKYIKKGMNKVLLQDIRLKDDLVEIDELSENEYFIREIINNKKTKEYEYNINKFNPLGL
jgi:phage/plasmid-associated DNA primase